MNDNTMPGNIAERKQVRQSQKAWKYIRDVNNTSLSDLSRIAVEDGKRKYTYGLMFREWERYASVFTALGMTGANSSRAGLLGSTCAETIFSFYALDMTGAEVSLIPAYSAFTPARIMQTIRSEELTDFIITDDFAQQNLINDLLANQKKLGLRNIIVLHVPVAGVTVNRALRAMQETKYAYLKAFYGPICMDTLLDVYGSTPVSYADEKSSDAALILHTTGTTSGTGKPVPLSDSALNAAAACFYDGAGLELPWDDLVTSAIVDLSNAYSMIDQVHVPFAMGAAVVCVPGGVLNPRFYRAIPKYGISFLFTISAMFERWMKLPEKKRPDFSSLRFVVLGGTSVSAADKRRYYEFMKENGAKDITLLNGYGISELGGACILSGPDIDDESIGRPLPGVSVRLLDEEKGKYLSEKDAPCDGVLYLHSPSIATPELDGREVMKIEKIEGRPYVCTNDLVRLEADGRLTFLGRANRYFINDEGRKYESGRVETEFARQSGIESCGVVPVYVKTTHDNIPMLCVSMLDGEDDPKEVVIGALRRIFIEEKTLRPHDVPNRIMIAEELPRNGNGKIDLYRINKGEVEGETFTAEPVKRNGVLTDFRLVPYEEGPADMIKEVFDGISAELRSSMPFNNSNTNGNKEEPEMKNFNPFSGFMAMNKMGMQMMQNMMNMMSQNKDSEQCKGMPDMSKMMGSMPDMSKMMGSMQEMNKKFMAGMPDVQGMVQKQAGAMLPGMQQQMNQMMEYMSQMNRMGYEMMQKMLDQQTAMMNQFFELAAGLQAAGGAPKAPTAAAEKPAKAAAEKPAKAAKEPAKAKKADK
ncbi:MAG: AMP-binding protein [Mogibacterium sp.]|nr:AMP-binding protein [Mogibacterium sp.]